MSAHRTVISSKGQVIIPAELRERYGLKKGTPAMWTEEKGRLILTPITLQRIREIRGLLKPAPGEPSAFEGIFEERERERRREK
jgi:AbrB family looped-hinge helix DNA binding protein